MHVCVCTSNGVYEGELGEEGEVQAFGLVEQKVREQVNSHFLSLYIRKINLHGVRGGSHGHLAYTPTTFHLKVRVANSGISIVSLYKKLMKHHLGFILHP